MSISAGISEKQSRKRSKTFTGCWTCRLRKIKCDEGRPECGPCRDKHVTCEGYGTRLKWMAPNLGDFDRLSQSIHPDSSNIPSRRRCLPLDVSRPILPSSQIEGILRYIDALEPDVLNDGHVCVSIQDFGVFSLDKSLNPARSTSDVSTENADVLASCFDRSKHDSTFAVDTDLNAPPPQRLVNVALDCPLLHNGSAPVSDICTLFTQESVFPFSSPLDEGPADPAESGGQDEEPVSSGSGGLAESRSTDESWRIDYDSLLHCLEPFVVPGQERFLMDHYRNKVVNLFCVIDNGKSPWKTFHLPRVLQCAGELSFGGSTAGVRNALRNALFSVSAFYLSNDHRSAHRNEEAKKWGSIASCYRCNAIGLLKQAVEVDLDGTATPKYKEFLATTLSMITINVMSGDTNTCSVHLDGAEQLIKYRAARKNKFSRKAEALHRIYFYLRVIYESTVVKTRDAAGSSFSPYSGSPIPAQPRFTNLPRHLLETSDGVYHTEPSSISSGEISSPDMTTDMTAYECIYGIPRSLLCLLKDAVEVIDMVDDEHAITGNMGLSERASMLCDDLENRILDWPLKTRLAMCLEENKGLNAQIIYHQTTAFHTALSIYFSQNVRRLGYRYFREHVQKILDSIETIEKIKIETKVLAAPLFWPAFIGATEAFEPEHQHRFKQWYEGVSMYGIDAVRTGIEVVHKVWIHGPTVNQRLKSTWRNIVEADGHNLMLT